MPPGTQDPIASVARQRWRSSGAASARRVACSFLLILASLLASQPAQAVKTLRVALEQDVNGFDPQVANDSYSGWVCRGIFDPLLEYDYLKRPYVLRPATARALPEIRDGGTTIVVKLKPGIHFTPDPVFKGRPRELVAEDYVYSWKRLIDPRMRSFWSFYLDGKLVGADELVAAAKARGRFDYDAKLEGLQALDRYTLQIKLKQPDYMILEFMTTRVMAPVAREIVEAYGSPENGWTMDHPVGTGPFMLKEWRRGSRIVLVRNPDYRDDRFPETVDASEAPSMRANAGKRLPLVDQVEVNIIEEANPRLLAFDAGQLDYLPVPYNLVDKVVDGGRLRPEYATRSIEATRVLESAFTYTYFSMDDPVVGGYTADKVALRRAIAMAYDVGDEIRVLRKGQAVPATQMIPPGLIGHDPARRRIVYDPAAAQALLDRFGYRRGVGGFRTRPDGSPLVLKLGSPPSSEDREFDELWKRSMDAVGIRIEFVKQKFQDLLKMSTAGQLQMLRLGRLFTLRDGGAALEILYGKNIGNGMNDARFNLPEFDALFEQARALPGGSGAHGALREDGRPRGGVHAAHARHLPLPDDPRAAMGARPEAGPAFPRAVEVRRCRRRRRDEAALTVGTAAFDPPSPIVLPRCRPLAATRDRSLPLAFGRGPGEPLAPLQRERHLGQQRAGQPHRRELPLAVGVAREQELGLGGQRLEVRAEHPEERVVEAQHVDRRDDLAVLDPERREARHPGDPRGGPVRIVEVVQVADEETGVERGERVLRGERPRRHRQRLPGPRSRWRRWPASAELARGARRHERADEPARLDQRNARRAREPLGLERGRDAVGRRLGDRDARIEPLRVAIAALHARKAALLGRERAGREAAPAHHRRDVLHRRGREVRAVAARRQRLRGPRHVRELGARLVHLRGERARRPR